MLYIFEDGDMRQSSSEVLSDDDAQAIRNGCLTVVRLQEGKYEWADGDGLWHSVEEKK